MANEKNVTEKIENEKNENKKVSPLLKQNTVGTKSSEEESGKDNSVETVGVETIFSSTDTYLRLKTNRGRDKKGNMRDWYNYYVSFSVLAYYDEKSEPVYADQEIFFTPVSRTKGDMAFTLINLAFKDTGYAPVDIVKTVMNINDVETITYSLRLHLTTVSGVHLKYDFKTVNKSDKESFENYMSLLEQVGIIK